MKKEFIRFVKKMWKSCKKRSPSIFAGIGLASMVGAIYESGKATRDAMLIINEKSALEHRELTKKEVVKETWKCYIPVLILSASSVTFTVGSHMVNAKRGAALAAAYNISENAYREYRNKTLEELGSRKELAIRDGIAEKIVKNDPVIETEVYNTGHGNTLCYDPMFHRYFRSDPEYIRRSVNTLNERLLRDSYLSLNDFYYEQGLPESSKIGPYLGWDVEKGLIELRLSAQVSENNQPCLVMDYTVNPKWIPGGY